jgi:diguanylate cyclase (GGDEF)-like protein/PAS domain S-box-containing protein
MCANAQTWAVLGASCRTFVDVNGELVSRNILLILADAAEAETVRGMLLNSRDGPFKVEWVSRCSDACNRLGSQHAEKIAAIVVDLFLPDSQGIATIDVLLGASGRIPILVLSRDQDEGSGPLAVQRGAQDYLLKNRIDGRSLSKAVNNMLERSARAEVLLAESERARITLNSIGDAVISTDAAGNITYLNPVAEGMTGWSRQDACGRPLREVLRIIDGDSRETALNPLAMAIRRNEAVGLSANCVLIRRDGYESAIEDTAAPIHDEYGQVVGAVIVFRDVGVARAMSLRMSYLAQHDFLTELPNRMLLNDRLMQAMAAARRHRTSLAVLFVDVDHFKHINDSLGHTIGDGLLKSIARRLVACVRSTDTVSRHGGDEFVVLLSEVARTEDAAVSADKVLAALSAPDRIEQQDLRITASVGISVFPDDGTDAETLVKNADRALLHAKDSGRNRRQFFEPGMSVRVADRWSEPTARVVNAVTAAR